jgi:hypothetical protein
MTTREDKEYTKFGLTGWSVWLKTAEGVWPASAVLVWDIDDLEANKFTPAWSVRIITTF